MDLAYVQLIALKNLVYWWHTNVKYSCMTAGHLVSPRESFCQGTYEYKIVLIRKIMECDEDS